MPHGLPAKIGIVGLVGFALTRGITRQKPDRLRRALVFSLHAIRLQQHLAHRLSTRVRFGLTHLARGLTQLFFATSHGRHLLLNRQGGHGGSGC